MLPVGLRGVSMSDADRIRSVLSKPFVLPNGQVVKNRLLKSAMSETLGTGEGQPTEALLRLYRQWADGGIGLMVTGNVMVDRDAFAEPGNVCVEDDRSATRAGRCRGSSTPTPWPRAPCPGRQI
jgi:2,4-dienoyl-CoA reductase-like NADH-dependent reductase (Old Yellow Enzyme family)